MRIRLLVGVVSILIVTNLLYLLVLNNPKYTMDRINLNTANQEVILESSDQIDQILVFENIIYGIFVTSVNSVLFAYSDHFLFQIALSASFFEIRLKLASSIGIFVEIAQTIYLFSNSGETILKSNNQYLLKGLDQGIYSANYIKNWVFESGDVIYKISALYHQIYTDSQSISNRTIIGIKAWNLKNSDHDFALTMGDPDMEQKIQFNSTNSLQILDVNIIHSPLTQRMHMLVADSTESGNNLKLLTYKISLDGISLVESEKVNTVLAHTSYLLLGTSVVTGKIIDNKYSFRELNSHAGVNITIPSQTVLKGMNVDTSSIILYGGTYSGLHAPQPILIFLQLKHNDFYIFDGSESVMSSSPNIYNDIYQFGNTLYVSSATNNPNGSPKYQIIRFLDGIKPSLFLDNIDPLLQTNLLAIPVIAVYIIISYIFQDKKIKVGDTEKLVYPKNDTKL